MAGSGVAERVTYCVGTAVLLLRANDAAASLSSVESGLSPNDGLALGGTRSADLAANLGDVVPVVRHLAGVVRVV